MTVTVGYSGQARAAAGLAREIITLPDGAGIGLLLSALAVRHGERMAALVNPGERGPAVLLFVRGEQVDWRSPAPLQSADEVMLVSPISGG